MRNSSKLLLQIGVKMKFVIVTGMSGGGKRTALKMLEDMGFFCVDNLPVTLIEKFVELIGSQNREITKVALGLDVRVDQPFENAQKVLENLKELGYVFEILFMEASKETLLKRYKETRRRHPLSPDGRVEDGIHREQEILSDIRKKSDYVFDTSNLLIRELKEELEDIFIHNKEYNSLMVSILSFGFKHGIPADADLVFDVRFLPNPFYLDDLKHKTGNEDEVRKYVMQFEESTVFLDKLEDMLTFLIPNYVKEGKYQLVVAIGCTGGKHRSVTLANELYSRLKDRGSYGLKCYHRDVGRAIQ